jgi:alpha-tubulin suppressor-like RCC1 family protein
LVIAGLVAGCVLVGTGSGAADPAHAGSTYTPRSPLRVLNTLTGVGGVTSPVGSGRTVVLDLSARVPAGATAVVLNVTGVSPTVATYVTAFPHGQARPTTSNLNLPAGDTRPNLVTVAVGADRKVDLYNAFGNVNLIADLAGHYATGAGARYTALPLDRVLDTRTSGGPLAAGGVRTLDLSDSVPRSATAVTLNVTGVTPTAATFVTAWPAGTARPDSSNLNLPAGSIRGNLVTVALGADRKVSLYNHNGSTHLTADLAGFYTPDYGSEFVPLTPTRVLDTRDGAELHPGEAREVSLPVPDNATSALVNVTGVQPTANTYLTLWTPLGGIEGAGAASTLNLARNEIVATLASVELRPETPVVAYNNSGIANLVGDLQGVFVAAGEDCVQDCVLTWGENVNWERGDGNRALWSADPTTVLDLSGVTSVARSGTRAFALRSDGTVWAWGTNLAGQLGNEWRGQTSPLPVQVSGLTAVTAIAAGAGGGLALRSDGTVWAWGDNSVAGLGDGTGTASTVPVRVKDLTGVTAIAAGRSTGYALRADGTVWAWGSNATGELGAGSSVGYALTPVRVSGLTGVTGLSSAAFSAYALRSNGTVWSWGSNEFGQLGTGSAAASSPVPVQVTGAAGATSVVGGSDTAYAIRADGTLLAWGNHSYGLLGNGAVCDRPSGTGCESAVPVPVSGLTDVTGVAAGPSNAYALRGDGTVWGWGGYHRGQLGAGQVCGTTGDCIRIEPVPVAGLTGITAIGEGVAVAAG